MNFGTISVFLCLSFIYFHLCGNSAYLLFRNILMLLGQNPDGWCLKEKEINERSFCSNFKKCLVIEEKRVSLKTVVKRGGGRCPGPGDGMRARYTPEGHGAQGYGSPTWWICTRVICKNERLLLSIHHVSVTNLPRETGRASWGK